MFELDEQKLTRVNEFLIFDILLIETCFQMVSLSSKSNPNECRLFERFEIIGQWMCAGGESKDACQGFGGAPLVFREHGVFKQV